MGNRCRVRENDGHPSLPEYVYGEFLGLIYERGDEAGVEAIVRLDGHGLFLAARHPSRVELLPLEGVKP
jgi:hypothetical protein